MGILGGKTFDFLLVKPFEQGGRNTEFLFCEEFLFGVDAEAVGDAVGEDPVLQVLCLGWGEGCW